MWVLEAWQWAEKVWFPVAWEQIKYASNVIDYGINEEITIWDNSFINANNNTTTWDATLVYWVNAPRILEKTSIYQNSEEKMWSSTLVFTWTLDNPDEPSINIRSASITNNYWNIELYNRITTGSWVNWVLIPVSWWYQLDITYAQWWGSQIHVDTIIKTAQWFSWDDIIDQYLYAWSWTYTWSVKYYFNWWTAIYVNNVIHTSLTQTRPVATTIVITKL